MISIDPQTWSIGGYTFVTADQSLAGASFTSVAELRAHIDAFVDTYNEQAKPFACTKSEVYQKRLKARFADQ